jgi:polysaccharide chain length determinant protein (PEP-CTERM system associated)
MNTSNLQQLLAEVFDRVHGMWRYRWWANGVAWLMFLAGWLYICTIPDVYRASAKVFVDTNGLLKPLLAGLTAAENPLDEVQVVSKAVLTRPNLAHVANTTDLALRATTPQQMETLISGLQTRIKVSGGRDNIFTIEYEDRSREKARDVVAAVLDTFIESAQGNESTDSAVTERALAGEISVHEQRLREAEENLAKFKQQNLGYMPGEYGDYYNRLQNAIALEAKDREKLRLVTARRDELKRQIEGEEPVFGLMPSPGANSAVSGCSQATKIEQLEAQLSELRVQYTDKHPRVVYLQDTIASMVKDCAAERAAVPPSANAGATADARLETNPVFQNLRIQLSTAEADMAELRAQLSTSEQTVANLHRDVDRITEVEAQLKQLNRDYNVIQTRHQELLKRWEDLQAKKRLDPVTDDVLFRRIEPPFAPATPVGPKRALLLAGLLVLSLGVGLVVAFGLDMLRPTFFSRVSLRRVTHLPVLGSVSMILTPREIARRRLAIFAWGATYAALVVCSVLAVMFAGRAADLIRSLTGVVS